MNATLNKQKTETVRPPANLAQMAKMNQLIADQKPTMKQMQQACRFVPDLLKADLSKINRYDFCRHIGRGLPFMIHTSSEITVTAKYGNLDARLSKFYTSRIIKSTEWLEILAKKIKEHTEFPPKTCEVKKGQFFVVGCCNEEELTSFDLRPADLYEFLAFQQEIHLIRPRPLRNVAGKCGSGWLWYSMNPTGDLEYLGEAFPDDRSYEEIFRYGKQDMPTLVRRVEK